MRNERYRHVWLVGGGTGRRPGRSGAWVAWYVPAAGGGGKAGGRRRLLRRFPNRELAAAFARRKTEELNAALLGDVTWAAMIEAFRAAHGELAENTQVQYLNSLALLGDAAGRPGAAAITPAVLQRHFSAMSCAVPTRYKHLRHLRVFCAFGLRQEPPWFARDPSRGVVLPRRTRRIVRAPGLDDVASILAATMKTSDPLGWYLLVRLAFETGLRQSDLINLRWSDLRYERVGAATPLVIDIVQGKTASQKLWCVSPDLERAIECRRPSGAVGVAGLGDSVRVLGWSRFSPKGWNVLRSAAGCARGAAAVAFHDLRRSAATHAVRAHLAVGTASRLLDHSSSRVTTDHYLDSLALAHGHALLLAECRLPSWENLRDGAANGGRCGDGGENERREAADSVR